MANADTTKTYVLHQIQLASGLTMELAVKLQASLTSERTQMGGSVTF